MRTFGWLAVWLAIGLGVWNGFYDLYVSRGAREYLQMAAEAELGRRPAPSMTAVMEAAQQNGARAGAYWAVLIVGVGWTSVWTGRRRLPSSRIGAETRT